MQEEIFMEENIGNGTQAAPPKKKKLLIAIAVVAVLAITLSAVLIATTGLSADEKRVADTVRALQSGMNEPDSFQLYGDILQLDKDEFGRLLFVDYSTTNRYGGRERNNVTICNGKYLNVASYAELSDEDQRNILLAQSYYQLGVQPDSSSFEATTISGKKIAIKLKIEWREG
jgi:hypothetical protein